jgi:membrane protein DedA with SNARE-associated domain
MIEELLAQYGYVALFVGAFLEGEVVVVISGILSRLGYLSLPLVFILVYIATFLGDQTCFYLARKHGMDFLLKRPHIKARADRVHALIDTHQNKVLFGFRFLYGLRIPTLIALGTSSLSTRKFVLLNSVNCLIWTIVFVIGGYFFGDLFLLFLDNIKHYEKQFFLSLAAVAVLVWILSLIRTKEEYK